MTKSLVIASALAIFAAGAFAQAPMAESAPKAAVKTMKHKHAKRHHHHAAAKSSAMPTDSAASK